MRRGRHRNTVTARLDRTLAGAALFRKLRSKLIASKAVGFDLVIELKAHQPLQVFPSGRLSLPELSKTLAYDLFLFRCEGVF